MDDAGKETFELSADEMGIAILAVSLVHQGKAIPNEGIQRMMDAGGQALLLRGMRYGEMPARITKLSDRINGKKG